MELKNIFKMTKTDRYTQDGRDELAKLQETQDKVYQIGEISQKTGLQKTANGWRPVKKNGAAAGSGGNTPAGVPSFHGMESGDYDNKLRAEGWETGGWEGNAMHSSAIFKKGDRTIRVVEGQPGKISHVEEIKPKTEAKPAEGWTETRMASGKLYDLKSQGKRIIEQYDPETETKTFKLRDLNNSRAPDKEFKTLEEAKSAVGKKNAAENNLEWNEMPSGRVWTTRTPGGKNLTVTWNREKNGDVWYGRSDSETKYKSKEEAMNAPVNEPEWMGKINAEFGDVIKKNPNLKKWLEQGRAPRLVVPGEGTYLGEAAKERFMDLSRENRSKIDSQKKQFKLDSMEIGEGEARDLIGPYLEEDAAPKIRELTGDCKIKIRQTQDVKYNTGDISQKTGLQKQPDGSWAPPKTGKTPGSKPEEQTATEAAKTSQEKPVRKSLNQIMLEKKGFKRVENSTGPRANMPRYQYTSRIGKTYNVWRGPAGIDGFVYYVQTPGGFAKKMKDVDEIKRYLESDGGNWGNAPGPRGLFHSPGESRPATLKETSPDDWAWAEGVASRNNIHPMDLIKNNKALKPGVNVKFSTPKDGELEGEIVDIAGYEGKAYVQVSTKKGNRMIPTEKLSVDSAPRQLTGDTKIRIRK